MALINKLENIGDAIREKTGTTDLLTLDEMVGKIEGISAGPTEADLTFSGNLDSYFCSGQLGSLILDKYKDLMSFDNITAGQQLFNSVGQKDLSSLVFNLNNTSGCNFQAFFNNSSITALPKLVGKIGFNQYLQYPFGSARYIREIPYSVYEDLEAPTNNMNGLYCGFQWMTSLKEYPEGLVNKFRSYNSNSTFAGYYSLFLYCVVLSEITNLFVNSGFLQSNCFENAFSYCQRVKNITFETNSDGTPKQANWKNQTIQMTTYVGYGDSYITNYNSGITADKKVTDDETYAALKDDPDWFTAKIEYSRYNHDSAVRTINSLPDTSAYLATAGGTNTIKFTGEAGSKTDGGAINTLTEEEIAVATSRGWTVTLV